ncbi:unnamed protein product, partial [Ixodes pacificus]
AIGRLHEGNISRGLPIDALCSAYGRCSIERLTSVPTYFCKGKLMTGIGPTIFAEHLPTPDQQPTSATVGHCMALCRWHNTSPTTDIVPHSTTGALPMVIPAQRLALCCPRPLVFCRCHDRRSVADPKPPSATGVLPVPLY